MKARANRLDLVYEGRFGTPSLDFAVGPGLVLKSLVKAVSSRWPIASQDIALVHSFRVSDIRIRATLFNGRGTIEVDADKIGVHFEDARVSAEDRTIIRDCLKLALEGIGSALKGDSIANDTIRAMLYAELLEDPKNNLEYLKLLSPETKKFARVFAEDGSQVGGGIKFDVNNEKEHWLYAFEMNRAFRSSSEIFVSASLSCFAGCKLVSLDDRMDQLQRLLVSATTQLGLEMTDGNNVLIT